MNDIQCLIDRQLGIYCRLNYDNILKRLVVDSEESFYGLQNANIAASFDQDPPIFACRFSEAPGYEHVLALANEDGRVAIQDTSTAKTASTLEGFQCHNNAVFDLAWMPQHMNFVTVSGMVMLNFKTKVLSSTLEKTRIPLKNYPGHVLETGWKAILVYMTFGGDHTACLWDVAEGAPKRVLVFSSHTRSVKTAVFRPTEPSVFATGARDGHILVWDIRANNQPSVVLKPDNCLMSCHSSFNPKTPGSHGKRPRIDTHRAISITGLVFQDDMTLISCGECDGNIKVWDLRKNYNIYKREPLPKHSIPYCGSSTKNGYTNLIIDDARMRLYASCMDNVIYCFNISTYNAMPEQRYIGHENSTFYIKTCLSPDSSYLVSGSSDKNAYVWNVKYSQPVVRLSGHWAEVTCAAWCQLGDMKLVTCSDDARHKIWRVGRELSEPTEHTEHKGRAELVPRADVAGLPHWGALDKTPNSLKRKLVTTPGSYSAKRLRAHATTSIRKTKRCLTDLMNASRDADDAEMSIKRLKLETLPEENEPQLLPAGIKRHGDCLDQSPPRDNRVETSSDWCYMHKAGSSFMTPTKNYDSKICKMISPKGMKPLSPTTSHNRSPVQVTPSKVRIISFTTPTKNLPNYVLDGEAPHLRLMSPAKKKDTPTDWLTLMVRERKGKCPDVSVVDKLNVSAPLSPKENIPTRRTSVSERTPKSSKKSRTLLKYFNVTVKGK